MVVVNTTSPEPSASAPNPLPRTIVPSASASAASHPGMSREVLFGTVLNLPVYHGEPRLPAQCHAPQRRVLALRLERIRRHGPFPVRIEHGECRLRSLRQ